MSREMANAAIDIRPDEAVEAMHLAAPSTPVCYGPRLSAAETGVHEHPERRRAFGL